MEPGSEPSILYTPCQGKSGMMPSLILDAASPNAVGDCISVLAATHTIESSLACSQVKPLRFFFFLLVVVFNIKTFVC